MNLYARKLLTDRRMDHEETQAQAKILTPLRSAQMRRPTFALVEASSAKVTE